MKLELIEEDANNSLINETAKAMRVPKSLPEQQIKIENLKKQKKNSIKIRNNRKSKKYVI